jgi:hypothetical protein
MTTAVIMLAWTLALVAYAYVLARSARDVP